MIKIITMLTKSSKFNINREPEMIE